MKFRIWFITGTCFLVSSTIVIVLFLMSTGKERDNSLVRVFKTDVLRDEKVVDVASNAFYFAGSTINSVYLGSGRSANRLMRVGLHRLDTQSLVLCIDSLDQYQLRSWQISVDTPFVYFADGTIPAIFRGRLSENRLTRIERQRHFNSNCQPIGSGSYVLTVLNQAEQQYALAKQQEQEPKFEIRKDALESQGDGIFSVDGVLHFDRPSATLVYVYFYRNQFLVMDTSLNVRYRGRTIDTTGVAKLKVDTIRSSNAVTLSGPPLMINNQSSVTGERLFIYSNRLSRDEDRNEHYRNATIDVYGLNRGDYQFSFYVPEFDKNKLRSFKVIGNQMLCLYDRYLVIRTLNFHDTGPAIASLANNILLASKMPHANAVSVNHVKHLTN